MIRNVLLTIAMAIAVLLVVASAALAGDPSQIGQHLENIVSPNVKSFWKIALIVGCVICAFGRVKSSIVVAFFACIVLTGAVIYNPGGFANTVSDIGQKIW